MLRTTDELPDECRLSSFDPLQIAWAAGFFDGEGSTIAYFPNKKSRYLRVQASVPQSGHGQMPEVLKRFAAAMLGMGKIVGPNEYGIYVWKTRGFEEAQATIALLWGQLGPVKRAQASAALKEALDGYRTGRLKARPSRRRGNDHVVHATASSTTAHADDLDRAWAAGFLDAEGASARTTLGRGTVRSTGTDFACRRRNTVRWACQRRCSGGYIGYSVVLAESKGMEIPMTLGGSPRGRKRSIMSWRALVRGSGRQRRARLSSRVAHFKRKCD